MMASAPRSKPALSKPASSAVQSVGVWTVERRLGDGKFPYRIEIRPHKGEPLVLWAQARWPAANRNIYCLRITEAPSDELCEELEEVPIVALQRRGVRLSVVLDRARYKRCDFLFLKKAYKNRPGEEYEQIYWQTQRSMVQHRPTVVPVALRNRVQLDVRIASDERYPWSFPGSHVSRAKLAAGDYALMDGEKVKALVERKTLDNLLHDFGIMPIVHQRMLELSAYEHNALVIEAPYEDFLNPAKVHHFSASFCAAAIAELYAAHPRLKIVFCANRKTANQWTASFFSAVALLDVGPQAHILQPELLKGD
jgi:hypothetical protein